MVGGHVGRGLSGEVVELDGGDTRVDTSDHLLGDDGWVNKVGVQAVGELVDLGV